MYKDLVIENPFRFFENGPKLQKTTSLKLKMNLFRKIYSSTIYFIYSNLMANSLTGNDSVSSFETHE